jgi:hypothetical protein
MGDGVMGAPVFTRSAALGYMPAITRSKKSAGAPDSGLKSKMTLAQLSQLEGVAGLEGA